MIYNSLELKFYLENRTPQFLTFRKNLKYKKSGKSLSDRYTFESYLEIFPDVHHIKLRINNVYFETFFSDDGSNYHPIVYRAIVADRKDCFDKITRCCLRMSFPFDENELFNHLRFLSSDDGFKYSNEYEYLDLNKRRMPWGY